MYIVISNPLVYDLSEIILIYLLTTKTKKIVVRSKVVLTEEQSKLCQDVIIGCH